jgi:hypothetical protein
MFDHQVERLFTRHADGDVGVVNGQPPRNAGYRDTSVAEPPEANSATG